MRLLKEKIMNDGVVIEPNILKVDHFINHQIDVALFVEIGKAFKSYFKDKHITKIVTVEASGIAVACMASLAFDLVPVVFAKKGASSITSSQVYEAKVHSFTKNKVFNIQIDKRFISKDDHVLIVDDFLANGQAAAGLASIVEQAGATVEGIGIVIEKGFQTGRECLNNAGYDVCSLAIIDRFESGRVILKDS